MKLKSAFEYAGFVALTFFPSDENRYDDNDDYSATHHTIQKAIVIQSSGTTGIGISGLSSLQSGQNISEVNSQKSISWMVATSTLRAVKERQASFCIGELQNFAAP